METFLSSLKLHYYRIRENKLNIHILYKTLTFLHHMTFSIFLLANDYQDGSVLE